MLQLKVLQAAGWPAPTNHTPCRPSPAPAAAWSKLRGADGILVPGGFGGRGIEGGCLALPCCGVRCPSQQPAANLHVFCFTCFGFGATACHTGVLTEPAPVTCAGKILAANYARTHDKPYLGICLGMQVGGGCRQQPCRLLVSRWHAGLFVRLPC